MPKLKDLRGKKFGRLTVLNEKPIRKNNQTLWKCKCECGKEKYVFMGNLTKGKVNSCGCLLQEARKNRKKQNKRLIHIFSHMKQRCYNKKSNVFKHYGGRGIKICDEWLNNSKKFYDWALSNGYKDNLTIDRINVNGNYEPSNCRWVTMKVQQNNRTNNRKITINGKTKTASQWAEKYGLTHEGFMWKYKNNKV